jgi:two-component system, NarL family, sensor histidine kinase UhpB
MKENNHLSLLVIEDNPGDYLLLKKYIKRSNVPLASLYLAEQLNEVESIIKNNKIDIAFLDLTLPDSAGIHSFITLNKYLPHIPIIILSGLTDMDIALEAISLGAQDYLIKGEFDEKLLAKSIQYSLERKRIIEKLEESNERYKYINKAASDIVYEWDFITRTGLWGEGFINTLGYAQEDLENDAKSIKEYFHPDDAERVGKKIGYHIENGIEKWQDEFRILSSYGSYKYVQSRGFILFNDERKPYRMYASLTDVTEKQRLEKELAEQQLNSQRLITEVGIRAQEKERDELGKELHDNINQVLATVKMYLGSAKNKENNRREELLSLTFNYVEYVMEEIRKMSKTLVAPSLGNISLVEALQNLVTEVNVSNEIEAVLINEVEPQRNIDNDIELMLYRITQEQLNNISKHAKADKTIIKLRTEEKNIFLSISDNGIGFDPSKKAEGIGLRNISSRVAFYSGSIRIISAVGRGCTIEVGIPR